MALHKLHQDFAVQAVRAASAAMCGPRLGNIWHTDNAQQEEAFDAEDMHCRLQELVCATAPLRKSVSEPSIGSPGHTRPSL